MKSIPFHKAYVTKDEILEVTRAVRSGWWTMGPRTVEFEEKLREYIGSKYALAVSSCTAALHLALEAAGIKENDEVLVPAVTFTSTAEVVCYFKAKPVLVDVEMDTCNIDVSRIEENINCRTRAIIPVHYGGQPADMDEIISIARRHRLTVIEDAAHALPAFYKGKLVGGISDMTCFSFYATKTLATGDGGMITTNDKNKAERIKIMRLHGVDKEAWKRYLQGGSWYYEVVDAGFKYNFTDIQASLGLAQFKKLELMLHKREKIARKYNEAFALIKEIMTPEIKPDRRTSWHLYPIKLDVGALRIGRNGFIETLFRDGVSTSVHFIPLYRHPFYKQTFGYRREHFPNSEWVYERILSLPIYPSMTGAEVSRVIAAVIKTVKDNRK